MSPDTFEDEIRTLLHDATDSQSGAFDDVDAAAVLGGGRRVVRRRRVAMVGGTLAAALVVAGGTWAALDDSADRAAPVPATRTTMADIGVVSARVDLQGDTYTVRLDTATGSIAAVVPGSDAPVPAGSVRPGGTWSGWDVVSRRPLVVAGVVPSAATRLMPQWFGDVGGVYSDVAPLPGTPYQAVVWRAERSPRLATLAALNWSDGKAVWTDHGTQLPSAVVDDQVVYLDRATGELGAVGDDATLSVPTARFTDHGLVPVLSGSSEVGTELDGFFVALLPPGSRDVDLESLATRGSATPVRTAELPDGAGTVVTQTWRSPKEDPGDVAELWWTDATGGHVASMRPALVVRGTRVGYSLDAVTDQAVDPQQRSTVLLQRLVEDGPAPAPVVLRYDENTPDGVLVGCAKDGSAVCAVLPDPPASVTVLDRAGRVVGNGADWTGDSLGGSGRYVLVVATGDSGADVAAIRWTDDVSGRTHTVRRSD
ncbi:hypothetical protein [Phycicoccus flavus]|uniref:hypothetical protein n=1 Tax=Phycicoccus flavus TaxID=2502783 RepID=UPI000FEB75E4|nr:hypothetical protein [Phycicoccus flavus]NHA69403.1 hypothetical protein [Phycicoccus flavus]